MNLKNDFKCILMYNIGLIIEKTIKCKKITLKRILTFRNINNIEKMKYVGQLIYHDIVL